MKRRRPFTLTILSGLLCLLFTAFPTVAFSSGTYETADCFGCHREGSTESRFHMSAAAFRDSVHGGRKVPYCHRYGEESGRQTGEGMVESVLYRTKVPVVVVMGHIDNRHPSQPARYASVKCRLIVVGMDNVGSYAPDQGGKPNGLEEVADKCCWG